MSSFSDRPLERRSMGRSAVIAYNQGSGRRRDRLRSVSKMVEALARRGISATSRATAAPGDAVRLSREALASGPQVIVVHGGNGTVNEAMQPLVGGPSHSPCGRVARPTCWHGSWACPRTSKTWLI